MASRMKQCPRVVERIRLRKTNAFPSKELNRGIGMPVLGSDSTREWVMVAIDCIIPAESRTVLNGLGISSSGSPLASNLSKSSTK